MAIDPGSYTLQVRPTGSSKVVLTVSDVRLSPNMVYTIYAVGLVGMPSPLEFLIPRLVLALVILKTDCNQWSAIGRGVLIITDLTRIKEGTKFLYRMLLKRNDKKIKDK